MAELIPWIFFQLIEPEPTNLEAYQFKVSKTLASLISHLSC